MITILVFFALVVGMGAAEIVQMDSKSYQKLVMEDLQPWTLFFYDSSMISDEDAMSQMLDKLEESVMPYGIGLGKVDCADIKGNKATRKICMNAGLQTIPAVGFVTEMPAMNPYTNKLGREIKLYSGNDPTDIKKIERSLISKNYPTVNVKNIKSTSGDIEGELDDLLEEAGDALVYLSSKDTVSLFTKSLCYAFLKMSCITVGGMSAEEIGEKFGIEIESLPLLLVRPKDGKPSLYPQSSDLDVAAKRDRANILEWVVETTGYSFDVDESQKSDAKKKDKGSAGGAPKDLGTEKFSASEFKAESLKEDEAWVLLISEGGYSALASEDDKTSWKKLAGAAEGAVRAGELDCSGVSGSGLGAMLCKERATPFMVMIPAGDEDDRSDVVSSPVKKSNMYDLSDAAKAKSAALNSLPDSINYIGEGDLDGFMMMSAQANQMGLLVMSDKTEAPPMLRNVKYVLDKEQVATLAFLSEPSAQFIASLNMPAELPMPAVFMLTIAKENPEGTPEGTQATSLTPYDPGMFGPLKFRSLMNFIMSVYQNSGYAEKHHQQGRQPGGAGDGGSGDGIDSAFGDITSAGADDPVTVSSQEEWERECGASFRGICVLAFTKKGTEEEMATINTAVITKLGKAGAAFKFLVVDGPCQLSFAERFDVSFDMMPAYAIYSPSKGRTVSLRESVTAEKVYLFLDAVLGGRATTYALAQRPTLSEVCELDESQAADPVEEEPMDDFLEEIRREEEEKAAALAKELKEERARIKEEEKKKKAEAKAAPKKVKKVIKKKKSKKSEL